MQMMHGQSTEDIYCTMATETLRQRAKRWKDWLSPSNWSCIEERWELKHSIMNCCAERLGENRQQMYQMEDKELKKRARAQKRGRTLERDDKEVEGAVHQNNK